MTLAFMLCFQVIEGLVMVEALIRLKGRTPRAESACVLARSLVTPAADLWCEKPVLMSNRMSGVTLRRPLIVVPQWKIGPIQHPCFAAMRPRFPW